MPAQCPGLPARHRPAADAPTAGRAAPLVRQRAPRPLRILRHAARLARSERVPAGSPAHLVQPPSAAEPEEPANGLGLVPRRDVPLPLATASDHSPLDTTSGLMRVTSGKSRVWEIRPPGSVRAKPNGRATRPRPRPGWARPRPWKLREGKGYPLLERVSRDKANLTVQSKGQSIGYAGSARSKLDRAVRRVENAWAARAKSQFELSGTLSAIWLNINVLGLGGQGKESGLTLGNSGADGTHPGCNPHPVGLASREVSSPRPERRASGRRREPYWQSFVNPTSLPCLTGD
jgi:hypothetical protein